MLGSAQAAADGAGEAAQYVHLRSFEADPASPASRVAIEDLALCTKLQTEVQAAGAGTKVVAVSLKKNQLNTLLQYMDLAVKRGMQNVQQWIAEMDSVRLVDTFTAASEGQAAFLLTQVRRQVLNLFKNQSPEHIAGRLCGEWTDLGSSDLFATPGFAGPGAHACPDSDDAVSKCAACDTEFTSITRKHHCRNCGKVFCHNCSSYWDEMPAEQREKVEQEISWFSRLGTQLFNVVQGRSQDAARFCEACYKSRTNDKHAKPLIQVLKSCIEPTQKDGRDALTLMDLANIKVANISKAWNWAAQSCLHDVCGLQDILPSHTWTESEKKILWANRSLFAGHSIWLAKLLYSVDWADDAVAEEVLGIFNTEKLHACSSICCRSSNVGVQCTDQLTPQGAQQLLCGPTPVLHPEIRAAAVQALSKAAPKEITCALPSLVHALRHEQGAAHAPLFRLLCNIAMSDPQFRSDLFWALTAARGGDRYVGIKYEQLREELMIQTTATLGEDEARNLVRQEAFVRVVRMTSHCTTPAQIKAELQRATETSGLFDLGPIPLPTDVSFLACGFDLDEIKIFDSAEKPFCLKVVAEDGSFRRFLFKKDDLRKDDIVLRVIDLMNYHLSLKALSPVLTYRVVPLSTTPNRSDGLVEFVEDARTLKSIMEDSKEILVYLVQKKTREAPQPYLEEFARSSAAYTVITYLLGVGDRHLDNMMLTESGRFFHIDFGFILGQDPKPFLKLTLALNRLMLHHFDLLGEFKGQFESVSREAYQCLRAHANTYISMLLLLGCASPAIEQRPLAALERELVQRFAIGKENDDAADKLLNMMKAASTDQAKSDATELLRSIKSMTSSTLAWTAGLNQQ